jgi:hypothetical protein
MKEVQQNNSNLPLSSQHVKARLQFLPDYYASAERNKGARAMDEWSTFNGELTRKSQSRLSSRTG